jgi:hypothetical protein
MVCKGTHIFLIVAKFLSENAKIAFSTLKITFPWAKNGFPGELSAQFSISALLLRY